MKQRYKNKIMQAAYENAYDCLYYGYAKTVWNNCNLDNETSNKIWEQALKDICNM